MVKGKLTDKEINRAILNVKATMEMEGIEMPEAAEELGKKVLKGEISANKAVDLIKSKYVV